MYRNYRDYRIILLPLLFLLAACDKEDDCFSAADFETHDGYALSAGTSTVFVNSSFAYDTDQGQLPTLHQRRRPL